MSIEDDTYEAFCFEIAKELLLAVNPETDDALVEEMLKLSDNPWDAPILYQLQKLSKEINE